MLSVLDCALETHKPMFPSVCLGKEILQRELLQGYILILWRNSKNKDSFLFSAVFDN